MLRNVQSQILFFLICFQVDEAEAKSDALAQSHMESMLTKMTL